MTIEHDATLLDLDESSGKLSSVSAGAPLPGSTIGGFTILEELGAGGMGVVLAGYDPELDRKVAIKMLRERPGSAGDEARKQRFLREAQALARLSHPNIVPVYEVGTDAGRPFIAMEHIDGQTLGAWAKDEPRTVDEVREVYLQAARGLAACHRAGLVHRDVKPANMLIDSAGRVRITDFGLVRTSPELAETLAGSDGVASAQSPLDATLTNDGAVLGTPAYAAPEQLRGAPVDARADQFAFCVALYEALFGYRPGHGSRDPARAVPAALETAVKRGLDIDPAGRYGSMDELIAALSPKSPSSRVRLWGPIAALVLAAAGLVVWLATRGDDRAQEAPRPVAAAPKAESTSPAGARAAIPPSAKPTTRAASQAELLAEQANDALAQGKLELSIQKFEQAIPLAKDGDPFVLARLRNAYSVALGEAGRRADAKRQLDAALAIYAGSQRRDPEIESSTHEHLGAHYYETNQNAPALNHFERSLTLFLESGVESPGELASKHNNVGAALSGLERHKAALPHYEKSLMILQKAKLTEELPHAYRKLADTHAALGNKARAKHFRRLRKAAIAGAPGPSSGAASPASR